MQSLDLRDDPGGNAGLRSKVERFAQCDLPAVQPGDPERADVVVRGRVGGVVECSIKGHETISAPLRDPKDILQAVRVQVIGVDKQDLADLAAEELPG